jgi:hypothetical protein
MHVVYEKSILSISKYFLYYTGYRYSTMVVPSVLCTVSTCSVLLDLNYIFTCTDFDEL